MVIAHIDLDAFFASCEEVRNPEVKDKPLIVGADPNGRGVVSTANYKAREYGIKSGMPISWAYRNCKHGVFMPVDIEFYSEISKRVMDIIRGHCDNFQKASIDECFIELKDVGFEEASKIADEIKKEILENEKVTCSIGLSSNKFISKIASDYRKPDGKTLVKPSQVRDFLRDMKVRKLFGVGPKTEEVLNSKGIYKVKDIQEKSVNFLCEVFGRNLGLHLKRISFGIDESEVEESDEIKSRGKEITFDKDISDKNFIYYYVEEIIKEVYNELSYFGLDFKTIVIKVRYDDFQTHTKQKTTNKRDVEMIKKIAKSLIEPFLESGKKIRLVGVSLSGLSYRENKSLNEVIMNDEMVN